MSRMKAFITRHALSTYFAVTFVISWGGVLMVVGLRIPGSHEFDKLLPLAMLPMLAGSSVMRSY
jgi:hypothetical protein